MDEIFERDDKINKKIEKNKLKRVIYIIIVKQII